MLQMKESLLQEALDNYKYSENRLKGLEDFVSSQKEKISQMEDRYAESEQVKIFMAKLYKITFQFHPRNDFALNLK